MIDVTNIQSHEYELQTLKSQIAIAKTDKTSQLSIYELTEKVIALEEDIGHYYDMIEVRRMAREARETKEHVGYLLAHRYEY